MQETLVGKGITLMNEQMDRIKCPQGQGLYDAGYERDACGIGFVANIQGERSHEIILKGIQILVNLQHRGASGSDPITGDGAGVLIQIPHAFFRTRMRQARFYPAPAGRVRHRHDVPSGRTEPAAALRRDPGADCARGGPEILGLAGHADCSGCDRTRCAGLPALHPADLHPARSRNGSGHAGAQALHNPETRRSGSGSSPRSATKSFFTIPSLSSRTIVYKGLLLATQIASFYKELSDPLTVSALCLVHQRFSTNTFPTWKLAHPFHFICHNGEINTLRGNIAWMDARQSRLSSPLFGEDMKKLFPIAMPDGSDSAILDNVVELLHMSGRSLPHAMAMLIPEAWDGDPTMSAEKEGFLRIPCVPDGTVGRTGSDRIHRRPRHRSDSGPQRPAPGALSRHARQPCLSWHPKPESFPIKPEEIRDEGSAAAGSHVSRRPGSGKRSFPTRRSKRIWPHASLTACG